MTASSRTPIETLLGCRHPVVLAGMGGVARSELVAAVGAAGGYGFLGMVREPPRLIEAEVARVRQAGIERFGVNIIPASTEKALLTAQIDTILALKVPAVELFWEMDPAAVGRFRDAGVTVVYQVGSVAEAQAAVKAGAEAIVAQGVEAGGHVRGTTPLGHLLPAVLAAVDVPVLAAGGLARGADLATAQALGAAGIVLGTALIAAREAFAHPHHQQRLVDAGPEDTRLTDIFHINWPAGAAVRVLANAVTAGERGAAEQEERVVIGEEEGRPIYLFSTDSPLRSMTGDFEAMALYAGTGVGAIKAVQPAARIIEAVVEEARAVVGGGGLEFVGQASPVCYADEVGGAYMGFFEEAEAAAATATIVALLRAGLARSLAGPRDGTPRPAFAGADAVAVRDILRLLPLAAAVPEAAGSAGDGELLERLRALIPHLGEGPRRRALLDISGRLEGAALACG